MKYFTNVLLIVLSIFSGCSDGGGSNSAVTGTFIDDPVQGLGYTCSSGTTGITDVNGEYSCSVGDDVTYSINGVVIGSVSAQTTAVTPYSLFPNDYKAALNFARLLQSIDMGNVNGKIVIDTLKEQKIPSTIDFSSASFETLIETASGITLVSEEEARKRLNDAITSAGGSVPTDLNHIPVASAGADQNINTSSLVTLDGSASSDADSDPLTYAWSITSKPAGSTTTLSDATVAHPTFRADVDGTYAFSLVVNDGTVNSASDTVSINAATAKVIKKTGQTHSYDANGAEVTDNSLKDDGYYQKGVTPDYTRTLDTVTDALTHLMWQDDAAVASVTKSWLTSTNYTTCSNDTSSPTCYDTSGDTATTYCTNLTLGGYTDWRLPTATELEGIVDYAMVNPALDTAYFNNVSSNYYWSSTTYENYKGNAWGVHFYYGNMYDGNKGNSDYVRCVRDGQ